MTSGVTTGVLGGRWRATVTPWGGIHPWADRGDAPPALEWHVAADDRWHSPEREAAVRQTRVEGTAVVETRLRIPNGDAIQRVYTVYDDGGLTIIEVENASPLPIVVAFTHGGLRSVRAPSAPIEGIELPEGSVAFPVGHHATLTVALPHDGRAGSLPSSLPPLAQVVRGWLGMVERASRLLLPDEELSQRLVAERCELALGGPVHFDDDPVAFLLGVGQLARMGEKAGPWLPDVAHAVELAARNSPRDWALAAALDAAATVIRSAGDEVAAKDLATLRRALTVDRELPAAEPTDPARAITWAELRLASPTADGVALLPLGLPQGWEGNNFEVYGLPNGHGGTASFAVRWHGERPAVLWEQTGAPVTVSSPSLAPQWSSTDAKGEALWPAPAGVPTLPPEGGSFR